MNNVYYKGRSMDQSPPFPIITDDFPQEAQDLIDGRKRDLKIPNDVEDYHENYNNYFNI